MDLREVKTTGLYKAPRTAQAPKKIIIYYTKNNKGEWEPLKIAKN